MRIYEIQLMYVKSLCLWDSGFRQIRSRAHVVVSASKVILVDMTSHAPKSSI